jgi:hypothetical protein
MLGAGAGVAGHCGHVEADGTSVGRGVVGMEGLVDGSSERSSEASGSYMGLPVSEVVRDRCCGVHDLHFG